MTRLLLSAAASALLIGTAAHAQTAPAARPTPADATAFVAAAEKALAEESIVAQKAEWVQETYITPDTNFLTAKVGAELSDLSTRYAKEAARFDGVATDPVTRRKLMLLKNGLVLAAPDRPGAAQEMADIAARLATLYSSGTATVDGKTLHLEDLEEVLATTRDPAKAKEVWEKWRPVVEDDARHSRTLRGSPLGLEVQFGLPHLGLPAPDNG